MQSVSFLVPISFGPLRLDRCRSYGWTGVDPMVDQSFHFDIRLRDGSMVRNVSVTAATRVLALKEARRLHVGCVAVMDQAITAPDTSAIPRFLLKSHQT